MYLNEHDPYPAKWLRNLYPDAVVDERSIADVRPDDIAGYHRVHLFAGIGGWEYALELAGWPEEMPVWTGSCPCQPFSVAGQRKGHKDERHLWPEMFRLIRECRPEYIFGEQVPNAIRLGWLDGIRADLEAEGYAVGACVLGAHSAGTPHIRQRLYWVANSKSTRRSMDKSENQRKTNAQINTPSNTDTSRLRLGNTDATGLQGRNESISSTDQHDTWKASLDHWSDFERIACADQKTRRVKSGLFPLAHGIPKRVDKLRAIGNAIVPQTAAVFIKAVMQEFNVIKSQEAKQWTHAIC